MRTLVYRKSRRQRGREPERHKLHVAKGDTVRVIRGEHRGKEGKILRVHPKQFRIVVEGVNVVKKHKRATGAPGRDRKSTRLNSSHDQISYAVFCLKKKKKREIDIISRQNDQRS